jgi:hypothetical protein
MRRDPWRRFLLRLCRELGVAAPRLLLAQVSSKEVVEWAAYFRWLDEGREAPTPAPAPTTAVDGAELSWQRLLSFADRVNRGRS